MSYGRLDIGGSAAKTDVTGLVACARIIVEQMVGVREGERVLIITDPYYAAKEVMNLVFEDALACGAESAILVTTPPVGRFGKGEIPDMARDVAQQADVCFACTSTAFAKNEIDNFVKKGKKFMIMHLLSNDTIRRVVSIDLGLLQRRVKKLVETMPKTEEARVMSPEGTDITFSLKDRRFGFVYDGLCAPGEFEGIPSGLVDITPVPGTANGVVVIDATVDRYQLTGTPMRITVKDGKVTNIEGGPQARFLDKLMKEALAQGDKNANQFAEYFLGLNPNARVAYGSATLIEGDRAVGALMVGFGRNVQIGGELSGDFHWDGQMWDTSLVLDDVAMIKNGVFTKELFG